MRALPAVAAGADPQDCRVLGEMLAAGADIFVTGDGALLRLRSIEGIDIVSPRRFWEIVQQVRK